MTETSDSDLIEILDKHRERIRQIFDHRARNPMTRPLSTTPTYDEMVKEAASALATHAVFQHARNLFILSRQIGLWPSAQAGNLLEQAARGRQISARLALQGLEYQGR